MVFPSLGTFQFAVGRSSGRYVQFAFSVPIIAEKTPEVNDGAKKAARRVPGGGSSVVIPDQIFRM